jgi:hypothetical protein
MFTPHRFAKFAATAVVAAGLGLGAVATAAAASAGSVDDTFLSDIRSAGIEYDSAASAIADAHNVCSALDGGSTAESTRYDLEIQKDITDKKAKIFVVASAEAYCPEHLAFA